MISDLDEREVTDEALIAIVTQSGDVNAFRRLFERYSAIVMGLAYKMVGDHALAEEIVQETFWRVWHNAPSYNQEKGSFSTWMFGIARNLCIDALRRYKRVQIQSLEIDDAHQWSKSEVVFAAPAVDTAEVANTLIRHEHVRDAMEKLPPEQRDVIHWVYFQGKTRREIAAEQNIPFGTINTRARLALQKLKSALQSRGFGSE